MSISNDYQELYDLAKSAAKNSYSPYSQFAVGAAILTSSGEIFTGVNIENVSYGLTICAERIAIGNTITNGFRNMIAIAIYNERENISPCGACRQFILEFGANIDVIFKQNGEVKTYKINELLPSEFTKNDLKNE